MASILEDIKKLIGPSASYDVFDPELIIHINSVFSILKQMGVGPQDETFKISGSTEEWYDFFEEGENLEMVKTYVYLKVKLIFDPPQASTVIEAYNRQIAELEWRLNVEVDPGQDQE